MMTLAQRSATPRGAALPQPAPARRGGAAAALTVHLHTAAHQRWLQQAVAAAGAAEAQEAA